MAMKKKSTPEKKKRNRKPGLKSTDGIPKGKGYKATNVRKGTRMLDTEYGSREYKILDRGGLKKLFDTPEALWKAACEYFEWVRNNPWHKKEFKQDWGLVDIPVGRPMTNVGMCAFWGVGSDYYKHFKSEMSKEDKEIFGPIINLIDNTIYTQKFEGAAVGAFNANIISRDLGLADNSNINLNDNRKEVADLFPLDDKTEE